MKQVTISKKDLPARINHEELHVELATAFGLAKGELLMSRQQKFSDANELISDDFFIQIPDDTDPIDVEAVFAAHSPALTTEEQSAKSSIDKQDAKLALSPVIRDLIARIERLENGR